MKIEKNSIADAYIMTYEVNGKKYMSYLNLNASVEEYNNWKLEHQLKIKNNGKQ